MYFLKYPRVWLTRMGYKNLVEQTADVLSQFAWSTATELNTHITEGKRGSKGSQCNPLISLRRFPVILHTFCQPVLKRENALHRRSPDWTNSDFISPHEVPSSTVTIVQLSRMCLRGCLWWIFLFSHLCKNPRLCCTAGFALRAGCWYPIGRSHTATESSGYTASQCSALQRRQKNWGAEGTISFSSYRKLSQVLGAGVAIFGTDSRMIA